MSNNDETFVNFIIYPQPIGHSEGPCSETCAHISCILKRKDALRLCPICNEPIGWGNPVVFAGALPQHYECFKGWLIEHTSSAAKTAEDNLQNNPAHESYKKELRRVERGIECLNLWLLGKNDNDLLRKYWGGSSPYLFLHSSVAKVITLSREERIEGNRVHDKVRTRRGAGGVVGKAAAVDTYTPADPNAENDQGAA